MKLERMLLAAALIGSGLLLCGADALRAGEPAVVQETKARDWPLPPSQKFNRGLTNILTGWADLPNTMLDTQKSQNTFPWRPTHLHLPRSTKPKWQDI